MLKIRLQRIGKRGQAYFRIVVTEHTTKPKGKYLELLGSYDPHQKVLQAQGERVKFWLGKGAQMSPTVNNLLITHKIIVGEKVKAWKAKAKAAGTTPSETKPAESAPTPPETTPAEPAVATPTVTV